MIPRFAITLFVSATLLFACQPMVARMIVPLLGGAPAVWIVCSLCFQALVLAGYFYAHVVGSRFTVRTQVALQLALVFAAFLVMPVAVDEAFVQTLTTKSRSLGLLVVLLRTVGLPFFVLSTTSPLLQRWFAELGETDPYHLYAASNAGSMLALLGYPFLVEPFLAVPAQSRALQIGYVGYAVLVVICASAAVKKRHPPSVDVTPAPAVVRASEDDEDPSVPPPASMRTASRRLWRERLVWIALAFAPSSLLLGATEFVTTDIASVPLLWVLPLVLYLASFIVAFAKKQVVAPAIGSRALAILAAVVVIAKLADVAGPAWIIVGAHMLLLFVASVVCHRALAQRRPHHTRLTEFYLLLSVGGVLGGVFNGLVAPQIFDDLYEYPIAIALVCLARAAVGRDPGAMSRAPLARDVGYGLALGAASLGLVKVAGALHANPSVAVVVTFVLPVLGAFAWSTKRPVRYGVALGAILLVGMVFGARSGDSLHKERGFFGVLMVRHDAKTQTRVLLSGTTVHGAQSLDPARQRIPLTYYAPTGPAGDVLGPLPDPAVTEAARRVGVIGLGVGSLASYARAGDSWTFFELNPAVVAIAHRFFSYLSSVPPGTSALIEVGDARLRLREGPPARFDVLVLDAFSSDAIPIHLVTLEALAIYRRALAPGGILLAHISNRHVRLEPVFAALAREAGLVAIGRNDQATRAAEESVARESSHWVVLATTTTALAKISARNVEWRALQAPQDQAVWTDDFADVLRAMRF